MSSLFHSAPVQNMDQAKLCTLENLLFIYLFLNHLTLRLNLSFWDHAVRRWDLIIHTWIIITGLSWPLFFFLFCFGACVAVSRQINLFSSSHNEIHLMTPYWIFLWSTLQDSLMLGLLSVRCSRSSIKRGQSPLIMWSIVLTTSMGPFTTFKTRSTSISMDSDARALCRAAHIQRSQRGTFQNDHSNTI